MEAHCCHPRQKKKRSSVSRYYVKLLRFYVIIITEYISMYRNSLWINTVPSPWNQLTPRHHSQRKRARLTPPVFTPPTSRVRRCRPLPSTLTLACATSRHVILTLPRWTARLHVSSLTTSMCGQGGSTQCKVYFIRRALGHKGFPFILAGSCQRARCEWGTGSDFRVEKK